MERKEASVAFTFLRRSLSLDKFDVPVSVAVFRAGEVVRWEE